MKMRTLCLAGLLLFGVLLFACRTPDNSQNLPDNSVTSSPEIFSSATPEVGSSGRVGSTRATPAPRQRPEMRRTEAVAAATAAAVSEPNTAPKLEPSAPALPVSEEPIPLTDMDGISYLGFEGGLYPGGSNDMPVDHAQEGLARAQDIKPLNRDGEPDPNGNYVFLSIGMSNTSMEFCRALGTNSETDGVSCTLQSFMGLSAEDADVNSDKLVMVNGARGGQVADRWDTAGEENYDHIRDDLLEPLNLSEAQVQVIWLKVANGDVGGDPSLPSEQADAYRLLATMGDIVRALKQRYPNLQQVFLTSRIYAGYATRDLNPEPYAYESGFAVKWLIEAQIRQVQDGQIYPLVGDLNPQTAAPWLAWGPYLWADGPNPRSDGLVWLPEDFGDDGTHPSIIGREKVGGLLLDFFKYSPFTRCWFLAKADPDECGLPASTQEVTDRVTATPPAQSQETSSTDDYTAIPLTDMDGATYLGFEGGLYPGGVNEMPARHAAEGLARAAMIQPLNQSGDPDPNGKIVLLSIGMSNTMMEFCGEWVVYTQCEPYSFVGKARMDPEVDHRYVATVNGARGAQVASRWDSPDEVNYDRVRDGFLVSQGFSEQQVQIVWLKVVDFLQSHPPLPSNDAHAYHLMTTMGDIVRALKVRYPNLQQVYLASRTYAGYATHDLSPEPYAYETGFAVKWLIEAQIEQMETGAVNERVGDLNYDTVAPWLAWGPYLWANGIEPRSDGLTWQIEDVKPEDGTHPSVSGRAKVADLLLDFFKTSPFTRCWFLEAVDTCG